MEEPDRLEQEPSTKLLEETPAQVKVIDKVIETENATPLHDMGGGYVEFESKLFQKDALKELRPDLFKIKPDDSVSTSTNFGTIFPNIAKKGDIFIRVDVLPNRVFKFDGKKWIEQNKNLTDSYLYEENYIRYLIEQIDMGKFDADLLSPQEEEQIRAYLDKGAQNT
jgi:hypothetical protein